MINAHETGTTVASTTSCMQQNSELFQEQLGQKIPQMSELAGSNHRCRAQFKCVQTVVGQRFVGN